jgi:hypothetical protein
MCSYAYFVLFSDNVQHPVVPWTKFWVCNICVYVRTPHLFEIHFNMILCVPRYSEWSLLFRPFDQSCVHALLVSFSLIRPSSPVLDISTPCIYFVQNLSSFSTTRKVQSEKKCQLDQGCDTVLPDQSYRASFIILTLFILSTGKNTNQDRAAAKWRLRCGLDCPGFLLLRCKTFSCTPKRQNRLWCRPSLIFIGYRGDFPR